MCGFVFFIVLCVYILHPHDLFPESKLGLVGLIDDLIALIIIFFLISILINIASSAIIAFLLAMLLYITMTYPAELQHAAKKH